VIGFRDSAFAVLLPVDTGSDMPWWLDVIIAYFGLGVLFVVIAVAITLGRWARDHAGRVRGAIRGRSG
jgi:hypothetical protein